MEMKNPEGIKKAAACYAVRKSREEHPDGSFDDAGRWTPDETEKQDCCARIRTPSRAYPYSLMTHCRSLAHICALHQVDAKDVRKYMKEGKR